MVIRLAIAASIIALFVIIYALVDCLRTPPYSVRSISKPAWVLSILLLPLIGALLWFFLGRPRSGSEPEQYRAPGSSSRTSAPDDDAAFLRRIEWEREQQAKDAELKKRENELKKREGKKDDDGKPDDEDGSGPAPSGPTTDPRNN
ncbi:PLDc N-terminal domain-containing protein [Zhihengliuella halotolerans]|uniref:PLDc N-terminal domain-containing protein n=1 Tax=Zhihengliuella halotolerans TaxID=370736 RepID=UPI000C80F2A2|nr:PLDc N-terminal domain-containing protein [Zhihengliuella halotolerans]